MRITCIAIPIIRIFTSCCVCRCTWGRAQHCQPSVGLGRDRSTLNRCGFEYVPGQQHLHRSQQLQTAHTRLAQPGTRGVEAVRERGVPRCCRSTSQALPSTAGPKVKGGACSSRPPQGGKCVCVFPAICEWVSAQCGFAPRAAAGLVKSWPCNAAGLQSHFPSSPVQESHRQEENPHSQPGAPLPACSSPRLPTITRGNGNRHRSWPGQGVVSAGAGACSESCRDHMWVKGPRR